MRGAIRVDHTGALRPSDLGHEHRKQRRIAGQPSHRVAFDLVDGQGVSEFGLNHDSRRWGSPHQYSRSVLPR